MSKGRNYPTRYAELWYRNDAEGMRKKACWRFVDASTNASVGPQYPDRIELLADLDRFAREFGAAATVVKQSVPAPVPVPTKNPADVIKPGRSLTAMWDDFFAIVREPGAVVPPDTEADLKAAFFSGALAILNGMDQVGNMGAAGWFQDLKAEAVKHLT